MKQIKGKVFGQTTKMGLYIITPQGEVLNLKNGRVTEVALYKNHKGYLRFSYCGKWYTVHRVVYTLFKGEVPQGMVIDHIDEDKENNCSDNLQVLTNGDNLRKHWALVKEGII